MTNFPDTLRPAARAYYDEAKGTMIETILFEIFMAGLDEGLQKGIAIDSRNETWLQNVESELEGV